MKKIVFALLCAMVLFASCNKEKPNEKFLGNYKAETLEMSAIISTSANLGGSENILNGNEFPITFKNATMTVTAGEKKDEVVALLTVEDNDETYSFNGTCNGDVIDFEVTTIKIVAKDAAAPGTNVVINTTIDGVAKLNEAGQLVYTASFTGNGSVTIPDFEAFSLPIELSDGKIESTIFEPQQTK